MVADDAAPNNVVPADAAPLAVGTGLPWDVAVGDAVAAIADARARHGDTFVVSSGADHYLFTFSLVGVESFYALPEEQASKGIADFLMLRRKLPDEIFDGRRVLPGSLFRRDDVASYLTNLDDALTQTAAELGDQGTVDVFDLSRRLAHRMGLASWAGPGSATGEAFDRLVRAFDILDGAEAFVHPDAMAAVAASGKRAERAALEEVVDIVSPAAAKPYGSGLFDRILQAWSDEASEPARLRGIGFDVALIHIASMSNLAAAMGWAVVDVCENPSCLPQILAGDDDFVRRCALESTRMAQRSIMTRAVLSPVCLDVGDAQYEVPSGWMVATLLPLLNTSVTPDLARWDPDRWTGHRPRDSQSFGSPYLVTAFGHGKHSCPAQPFSLAAMTAAVTFLFDRYHVTPLWSGHPRPVPAQIGGVARAGDPCLLSYVTRR
jgi:cytochrome P450